MPTRTRLTAFLSRFLAAAPAAACGYVPWAPLDDVACLTVAQGATCPDEADAEALLVGTTVCESPVREIVATGAFVSSEDVVLTGFGTVPIAPDSGDTGAPNGTPATQCCYEAAYVVHHGQSCMVGRPLVVRGRAVSAAEAHRADWCGALAPDPAGLDAAARRALAAAWSEAARMEHASIAAFARVQLDLIALGAPSDLVARTTAAMADEVAHARACFALASAYAGRPVGPGPLAPPAPAAPASLVRLAVDTFREGCVGETLAVALAAAQLRGATDPAVRAVLRRIVEDEGEHATLAWDVVRWAIDVGGDAVRHAVAAAAAAALDPDDLDDAVPAGPTAAAGHGIPAPEVARAALREVVREVVAPSTAELLAA